ncbi:hypothetical protein TWF481_002721 [Arthrobotrys musiformis]|uniref:Cullin-1 n=1 Tax=Arthrobotrys musiformis TaxID=47236 RepID=A0AAV9VS41_9PEZI
MPLHSQALEWNDLERTWQYLESGISNIMNDLQKGVDMKAVAIYNFCTSCKTANSSSISIRHRETVYSETYLLGEGLYNNLIIYLSDYLARLKHRFNQYTDEALLGFYIREWDRYKKAAKFVNNLFGYLNRHWVKREMDEGKKNVYDVYTLYLVRWKLDLFDAVQGNVMDSVFKLVENHRNGEIVGVAMIKSIVDSFVSLGLDENDSSKSTLNIYREFFEKPFLDVTNAYYQFESKQFIIENGIVEYTKKVETRLSKEEELVRVYLHPDMMTPLMNTCHHVLIQDHKSLFHDEVQVLLDDDRQDDLKRMYNVLSRITGGLEPLRTKFETHIRKAGLEAIDRVASQNANDYLDPKVYINTLLRIHNKYSNLVRVACNQDPEFVRSLDKACREFVNRNKVCKAASSNSAEFLAKYADSLLKDNANIADEADLEGKLDCAMTIFKYIEDKDVFQKFYSEMLAKRLIRAASASQDAETSMIGKLKFMCGFEYTNKLQRMFQDMQTSKDLNDSYKEWMNDNLDKESLKMATDFSIQVLSTSFWPLKPPNTSFKIPQAITKTYDQFQKFYFLKHSGRKLSWLWHLCRGDVKATFAKSSKITFTFHVSIYQIAILLMFNSGTSYSYEDIESTTDLSRDYLNHFLGVFIKAKVLNIKPASSKVGPETTLVLNTNFTSKKIRVNLNIAARAGQKQEMQDTHKTIKKDRNLLIQDLRYADLISETISQIRSRFIPNIPDIKRCIDSLLEKEYLERLDGDRLGYLA